MYRSLGVYVNKKTWIIFAVVVTGLMVALVVWSRNSTPQVDVSSIDTNAIQQASPASGNIGDHVFGKADSKVILIEYGDFQCPGCKAAQPGISTISSQYTDTVAFVFRNFPLTTIHANARAAAAAVEAAGLEGKYWEMHDAVYQNQANWENLTGDDRTNRFIDIATSVGLSSNTFKADLAKDSINKKISFDQAIGLKLNVNSTPSFYLGGKLIDTSVIQDVQQGTGDKLRDILDSAVTAAGMTPPSR